MTPNIKGKRSGPDDYVSSKCFIVTGEDARLCMICERTYSRKGSFEHSQTICYPPATSAN
jgi:hypothetical protein